MVVVIASQPATAYSIKKGWLASNSGGLSCLGKTGFAASTGPATIPVPPEYAHIACREHVDFLFAGFSLLGNCASARAAGPVRQAPMIHGVQLASPSVTS